MQRSAIALLLALGCASGDTHKLSVTVFETVVATRAGIQAETLMGQHMLRVQIENESHQEIVVHAARVAPAGPDLWTDDPSQSIEQSIGPGQSQSFDLFLTVSTSSRSRAATSQMLDSVSVDLSCTGSETGNFIDSGTYQVNHVTSGS